MSGFPGRTHTHRRERPGCTVSVTLASGEDLPDGWNVVPMTPDGSVLACPDNACQKWAFTHPQRKILKAPRRSWKG